MATIVETVERDGHRIAIYDNGMERDLDRGRLVRPPTSALITAQNTNEFYRLRLEKKQARAAAGANAAVAKLVDADGDPIWDAPVDEDYIEAIAEAQATLALSGNAYSTRAADWVMEHTGNKAIAQADTPMQQATELLQAGAKLLQLLRATIQPQNVQLHDTDTGVIDASE